MNTYANTWIGHIQDFGSIRESVGIGIIDIIMNIHQIMNIKIVMNIHVVLNIYVIMNTEYDYEYWNSNAHWHDYITPESSQT